MGISALENKIVELSLSRQQDVPIAAAGQAKYVFMFIGDGMGLPQINSAEAFLSSNSGSAVGAELLNFSTFPAQGLTATYANDAYITDSADAATALATGYKTNSGVVSMDPAASMSYETIAEKAHAMGMKVGIISSVDLDHATPACFYAHSPSRNNYYDIGVAAAAIQDTIAFADAVQEAIDFYNEHPEETLIVVTGDHECGGLTIGFAGTHYDSALLYGGYTPLTMELTHMVANRAGLAWTSYSHTGIPVPTFATGVGAESFNGYYDNTDVFYKTAAAMGL